MNPRVRGVLLACAGLLAVFAGWRIVGQMQAERHAASAPARALDWRPQHPLALQARAALQMRAGDSAGAAATARQLLAHEPLQGQAFRLVGEAALAAGDLRQALRLHELAAQRAPRDVAARAWLAQHYLQQGDYPQALVQIDRTLRLVPQRAAKVLPVLVQMAREPGFANALAATLRSRPPWRPQMLAALRAPGAGDPGAANRVMRALHAKGGLDADEYARWLDSLIAMGRWGEAQALWAGSLTLPEGRLPLLYNGDFAAIPTDAGFDWRRRKVAGVLLQVAAEPGTGGNAAYLRFLDRRVPHAGLEHPLLLAPGPYALHMRLRARALRSALGLQWQLACAGPAGIIGRSEPVEGSFEWQERRIAFTVPAQGCPGLWLRLVNPVSGAGAAQRIAGELWLDDARIARADRQQD